MDAIDHQTSVAPPVAPLEIDLLGQIDARVREAADRLDKQRRAPLGQFFTPPPVARLMASMLTKSQGNVELLDPGAGPGVLFAACVEAMCSWDVKPRQVRVTAYEIDPTLCQDLEETAMLCKSVCADLGVRFEAKVRCADFISSAASLLRRDMFSPPPESFTHVITNPPYRKIQSDSIERKTLDACGIETSNLYTAFVSLAAKLLDNEGQLISITPRSFCNGPYFKAFRKAFLSSMQIERLHLFHSRTEAFQDDDVLQENVIMAARKREGVPGRVNISASVGVDDDIVASKEVDPSEVVHAGDDEAVIHIVTDELERRVASLSRQLNSTLDALGIEVSTGRVVDFRATYYLEAQPEPDTVPLIYPLHFSNGQVEWPAYDSRKPNAIKVTPQTQALLVPAGNYVLVRRFSSKEEPKRIVAAVYDSARISAPSVGFENHLNYFHIRRSGLDKTVAKGLAAYLNSTLADSFFRQFSGHTQVNAADLRRLPYPSLDQLTALGRHIGVVFPGQDELDRIVERELFAMTEASSSDNPMPAKQKISDALSVLKALGFPRQQQNERSALTVLALLDIKPDTPWHEASAPLRGITPMMEFFAQYYGKTYKPNTRETVRRQTLHQFVDAGLIVENPDDPTRPTNSPNTVYQVERGALELLRTFDTPEWDVNLRGYLSSRETLAERYARERRMRRIPIQVREGDIRYLSPGGQNVLVQKVIEEFMSRFVPGGVLIYVGDTGDKFAYFDGQMLKSLGVAIEPHGKMPDVIAYYPKRKWLVLVEAVTSHGPVDAKRHEELKDLFGGSKAGLVFVTAFLTRRAMAEYVRDISWETEVWVADNPTHLIHFDGEKFIGPYKT